MVDCLKLICICILSLAAIGFAESADIRLSLSGKAIFAGKLEDKGVEIKQQTEREPAKDVYLGYPHGPKTSEFVPKGAERVTQLVQALGPVTLTGTIRASKDSMPCDAHADATLGSSFGAATNDRFNAVYDRTNDWLIAFEADEIHIEPTRNGYAIKTKGPLQIKLKENYIKNHLGYFLWNAEHALWGKPIAGWCSWMAHLQNVKEQDMLGAAEFFAKNLKDYGYDVIQMDDGFQRTPQYGSVPLKPGERFSDLWTKPNEKFPGGLESLAHRISALGLTPGIWVGLYLPLGLQNADGYITDPNGKPHQGPWVNYAMNGNVPKAVDEAYAETIRTLRGQGWSYFKIDTLRHVLYDNYRQTPQYWKSRNESMEAAYRKIFEAVKRETGPNIYTLACWGALPELAGIPDGCRIGEDVGPDVASMRRSAKYIAQFQHLNNVVWRNDPDYMCLRVPVPQAQTWASLTALAGGHIMVSDPVADYDSARVEVMRKVGPPMMLKPTNVAQLKPDPAFIKLDAEKDGEHWTVVTHFAWEPTAPTTLDLQKLGLNANREYLAFDFWQTKFLGVCKNTLSLDALKEGESQTISFRPLTNHPQVLGTDRHIGQGVVELSNVKWNGEKLSGTMARGTGQRWSLYLYIPKGWELTSAKGGDATQKAQTLKIQFPEGSSPIKWEATFRNPNP